MFDPDIHFLQSPNEPDLAWCGSFAEKNQTTILWLGGYASDMQGRKNTFLHPRLAKRGFNYLAFDYSGHGRSSGKLEQRNITDWRHDVLRVIDSLAQTPLILVGSSFGGWLGVLAAMARPVAGLVLLAPAVDMTERLLWQTLTSEQRENAKNNGYLESPDGLRFSYPLIEDGRNWLLMESDIRLNIPVRILHGSQDSSVPEAHVLLFARLLEEQNVVLSLIKDADHSLSRPQDLLRIEAAICELDNHISDSRPDLKLA